MTAGPAARNYSYFVTYSGVRLPFRLVEPIAPDQIENRNTFFRAWFDDAGRISGFDKMVYGEVELVHLYSYHPNGNLALAEIRMVDEDPVVMMFDEDGKLRPSQTALPA